MKPFDKDQILASDSHIFVVVKPANLLTQKEENKDSLEDQCKEWLQKHLHKEKIFLQPIHRLDKAVSGIVIFARSSKALSRLQEAMRKREITREYIAIVEGKMLKKKDHLIHYLVHGDHKAYITPKKEKGAAQAELFYEVLDVKKDTTKLRIFLKTGKYHQIRAQLAAIGHPVVGDQKYGSKTFKEVLYLHHTKTEFVHPVTKELLTFVSEPHF